MKDIDITKILNTKRKEDFIYDKEYFCLVYIDEIAKWIMCCEVFWVAQYQRYYLLDDADVDLYNFDRNAFIQKYSKEINQKQDCFTERFMGAGALRDYDGANGFQNAYPSNNNKNPFSHYGYLDGVLYAKICWQNNIVYVPPVQAIQRDDNNWVYPLRGKCELQESSEGIPICYKLKEEKL